ncbi:MAG: SMI1/KNR4 family protein [Chitinophagaceae bacterium]
MDFKKYFPEIDVDGNKNELNLPATNEEIASLERQLEIELPDGYKSFLKFTNGFEGLINEFVARFDPADQIYQSTKDTCAEFFPWAIYIGTNCNVEMFVIDKRQIPFQFGLLPFIAHEDDFIPLGDSFEKFIERLYNDTVFEKT